jgi:hypothetical protein
LSQQRERTLDVELGRLVLSEPRLGLHLLDEHLGDLDVLGSVELLA